MAYNPYYQQYPGYSYNLFPQTTPLPTPQGPQPNNNGFISVRSIEEAYNWPIAPGNSLTFKDECAPYIYTKTKGISQLEPPVFERFRLVKEDPQEATQKPVTAFDAEGQIKSLWEEVNAIKGRLEAPVAKRTKAKREQEEGANDTE